MTAMIILGIAAILSGIGVGYIRKIAVAQSIIDIPNERSSHTIPIPRGGGLSIAVVVLVGTFLLGILNAVPWNIVLALLAGGLVAWIGYIDDRGGVSPLNRAIIHTIAASLGLALLGGMPPLDLGFAILNLGWLGHLIGIIGIVWMINLYNFMDGIDGLAGTEAAFVFGSGGLLLASAGNSSFVLVCALFVGACLGFLRWNWPPAKIFMGDVASGFLGYSIGIIAIASARTGYPPWIWLMLISVFVVDATITLLRRISRGEKWYLPHRSHAYQHLTQYWSSHLRVTLSILGVNLFWLLPLTLLSFSSRKWFLPSFFLAMLPLIFIAFRLDAGK